MCHILFQICATKKRMLGYIQSVPAQATFCDASQKVVDFILVEPITIISPNFEINYKMSSPFSIVQVNLFKLEDGSPI